MVVDVRIDRVCVQINFFAGMLKCFSIKKRIFVVIVLVFVIGIHKYRLWIVIITITTLDTP